MAYKEKIILTENINKALTEFNEGKIVKHFILKKPLNNNKKYMVLVRYGSRN